MLWNLKTRTVIAVFCLCSGYALLTQSMATAKSARDVRRAIAVSPGLKRVLLAHASGSQIYACKADTKGQYSWTLQGPEAELKDRKGKVIGQHSAGPTWKLQDGSEVTGKKAVEEVYRQDSIPWLLLDVVNNSGKGALAKVTEIQRVKTHSGKAGSDPCDASHQGA